MTGAEAGFRVLETGTRSDLDVEHPTLLVADEASAWRRVWRDHAAADPPSADWLEEWAALLLAGTRPTGGYGVAVEEVAVEEGAPVLRYRETEPGDEDVVIQSLTQPWVAVAVERDVAGPEGADLERTGSPTG